MKKLTILAIALIYCSIKGIMISYDLKTQKEKLEIKLQSALVEASIQESKLLQCQGLIPDGPEYTRGLNSYKSYKEFIPATGNF